MMKVDDKVAQKLKEAAKGSQSAVSYLRGYATVNSHSRLSQYIFEELDKLKESQNART